MTTELRQQIKADCSKHEVLSFDSIIAIANKHNLPVEKILDVILEDAIETYNIGSN